VLRIASRTSPLAVWQATHVAGLLATAWPQVSVEVVPVDTEGDRRLDVPISSFGGKGVFAKEVQAAVLRGRRRPRRPLGQGPARRHDRRSAAGLRARAG
jgi:hydroxymethylbilane synthase